MADMTESANVGVSCTKKRKRCLLSTASTLSAVATAVAMRGEESTSAISPKTSSGPRMAMTRSVVWSDDVVPTPAHSERGEDGASDVFRLLLLHAHLDAVGDHVDGAPGSGPDVEEFLDREPLAGRLDALHVSRRLHLLASW